jgi:Flp pilus assembly protein TadD
VRNKSIYAALLVSIGFLVLVGQGAALADQATPHYHNGLAYKRQGRIKLAIQELRKAIELREDYAAAHHSIGMLYRKQGNHNQAISHLERAAKLQSKSGQVQYSLGIAYHRAGRKEDAIVALTRAAKLSPKDDQIQAQLGVLLIRKNPKGAIPYLKVAVKIKPNEADYLHQLGLAYRRTRDLKQAEHYMLKAAAIKEGAKLAFDLGVLYRRKGKPFKAIERYEKAIRLDPKLAAAHWDVAHMYKQARRIDDAIKAYERYVELKGGSGDSSIARKRIKELKSGR